MDDEMLCEIMAAAILKSACAEAKCRVSAEPHKWWVYVVHLDEHAHTCPACEWGTGYPRHFISNESLYMSDRGLLVKHLSTWLSHLHSQPADPAVLHGGSGGGGGAPIDADASSDAASRDGIAGRDGLSDSAWDRVASSRAD
jgi:hypothetical protein